MLYFAYGSNLDRAHFEALCPAARLVGKAVLSDHRLVFRRFATVEPAAGSSVQGALWHVTPRCEAALDAYEEVGRGLYRRILVGVRSCSGDLVEALSYRMAGTGLEVPTERYLALILAGYADLGLDPAELLRAAEAAGNQETPGQYATRPDA